ncbi:MAG TPA: EamA family transporter [Nocardioides sp.]|nr:EamA family transporter [Nocardioides sp.]
MIAVILALVGAACYGVSDFVGGMVGKRADAWAVAAAGGLGGAASATVLALLNPGDPSGVDLAWGAVAGIGNGTGTAFLYRGLSAGRMGVVAPVSGVLAVVIPVVVAFATGERPGALVWLGIVSAVPAIWLVAREPTAQTSSVTTGSGARDGVLAGLGFGALFACLGQIPDAAGFWPLVLNQLVSVLVVALAATLLGATWVPRGAAWGGTAAGVLGGVATAAFVVATHHGLLSVSAVLVSLYPAFTILLAALVLREHVHRVQAWGLALCGAAVVLVALG